MVPQLGILVGFVNESRPFRCRCAAVKRSRVAAVKVKKMLAIADRVNQKSLLDHEFSRQLTGWAKVKSVAVAQ
jgi:hypothetical protein